MTRPLPVRRGHRAARRWLPDCAERLLHRQQPLQARDSAKHSTERVVRAQIVPGWVQAWLIATPS